MHAVLVLGTRIQTHHGIKDIDGYQLLRLVNMGAFYAKVLLYSFRQRYGHFMQLHKIGSIYVLFNLHSTLLILVTYNCYFF